MAIKLADISLKTSYSTLRNVHIISGPSIYHTDLVVIDVCYDSFFSHYIWKIILKHHKRKY